MRRRFFRFVFTALAIVSTLLCAVACVLWLRGSPPPAWVRGSWLIHGDRYTLRFDERRMGLFGPPPAAAAPDVGRDAADVVGQLRNDQVRWTAYVARAGDLHQRTIQMGAVVRPRAESAAAQLEIDRAPADVRRPLLAA